MKKVRRITALLLCIAVMFTLTACSSKKSAKLQIFSNLSKQEGYTNAAKKHFSNVSWTGSDSVSASDLSDDTRYVVLIQNGEDVLSIEPIEGKRFTVLVYDKEGENIRITMRYCVGTTDNCVVKGNVVDGEMSFNRDMTLAETASADASKRAETIFNVIYQTIVDVEGE